MYFNRNIMVIALLAVVVFAGVAMGCCQPVEAFENATPMQKTLEDAIKAEVEKGVEEEEKKEKEKDIEEVKKVVTAPKETETPVLNKQEQELFEQITKNSLSDNDLKKLISAGILTENMVEKFLNKIDEGADEKIEGFCSGGACYASIA
jgi:hypothetical protein